MEEMTMEGRPKTAVDLLKGRRSEEGLNGDQFAQKLGISPAAWSLLSRGERRIGFGLLPRLKELYPHIYEVALREQMTRPGRKRLAAESTL